MDKRLLSVGLYIVCTLIFFNASGCGSPSYDLKSIPTQGSVHRVDTQVTMEAGTIAVEAGNELMEGTAKLRNHQVTEIDFLEVNGEQPLRIKVSHLQTEDLSQIFANGELVEEYAEQDPLLGRSLLFIRQDAWSKRLVGGQPTTEQQELMAQYAPPWHEELWSHGKLQAGDSWVVGGDKLAKMMGASPQNVQGQMRCHFEQIAEYGGESCALVSLQLDMTAKLNEYAQGTMSLSGEGHLYRSLARKVDVFTRVTGTLQINAEETSEGQLIKTTIRGPVVMEETTTVD